MAEDSGEMMVATEKIFIPEYATPPLNTQAPTPTKKKEKHLE